LGKITAYFSWFGLHRAKSLVLDALRDRLPLKVKHRVNLRNLYPPIPPFHSFVDKPRVVSLDDDIFVAVFNIGIRKRNLRGFLDWLCFASLNNLVISLKF